MCKTRRWYLSLPKANQVSPSTSFEIKTTSFPLGGSVVLDDLNALLRFFWRSSRWDERAMRGLAPLLTNRRCYTQPAVTHRLSSNNVLKRNLCTTHYCIVCLFSGTETVFQKGLHLFMYLNICTHLLPKTKLMLHVTFCNTRTAP